MTGTGNDETPGTGGDQGTRHVAVLPGDGHRHHRSGSRVRSRRVRPEPPDLGALAKDAVISFLHDASTATAERAAARAEAATAGAGPGQAGGVSAADESRFGPAGADASRAEAESIAWRAASVSLATLDRIEAAAASIEADIRAALQAQADLQAGAGAAAEAAVSAAASAWRAADSAVEADTRVKIALRRVEHFVTITVILLIIALILVVVGATPLG
ncbi:MAG: hypothetical protein ACLPKE_01760 [Streptosporangiaceae bacterium]